MTQRAATWMVWVLLLAVAVLVPAGLFSLTSIEPDTPTTVVSEAGGRAQGSGAGGR
jgi:hypothetical protein